MDSIQDIGFEYAMTLLHSEKYFRFIHALLSISFEMENGKSNLYQQLIYFATHHPFSYGRNLFSNCNDLNLDFERNRNAMPEPSSTNEHSICVCSDYLSIFLKYDGFVLVKIDTRQESNIVDPEVFEFRFFEIIYFIDFAFLILGKEFSGVNYDHFSRANAVKIFDDLMSLCNVNHSSCYFIRRLVTTPQPLLASSQLLSGFGVPFMIDCFFAHLSKYTIEGCSSMRSLITGKDVQELSHIRVMGFGVSRKFFLDSRDRFQIYFELFQRLFSLNECAEIQLMMKLNGRSEALIDREDTFGPNLLSLPLEILEKVLNDTTSIIGFKCNCANLFCGRDKHNSRCRRMRGIVPSERNFVFPLKCETIVNTEGYHFRKWRLVLTTSDLNAGLNCMSSRIGDDFGSCLTRRFETSFDVYNACHLQLADEMHFASCQSENPTSVKFAESKSLDVNLLNWFNKENGTWEIDPSESRGLIQCNEIDIFIPRIRNQLDHFTVFD